MDKWNGGKMKMETLRTFLAGFLTALALVSGFLWMQINSIPSSENSVSNKWIMIELLKLKDNQIFVLNELKKIKEEK